MRRREESPPKAPPPMARSGAPQRPLPQRPPSRPSSPQLRRGGNHPTTSSSSVCLSPPSPRGGGTCPTALRTRPAQHGPGKGEAHRALPFPSLAHSAAHSPPGRYRASCVRRRRQPRAGRTRLSANEESQVHTKGGRWKGTIRKEGGRGCCDADTPRRQAA